MIYSKEQLHVVRNGNNEIIAVATKNGQQLEIYNTSKVGFDDLGNLFEDMVAGESREKKVFASGGGGSRKCPDCDGNGKVNGGECVLCEGAGVRK